MEEIVREALNYVSTEKKEEVPDPKAKAKKGNEPAQVDAFAGLDTTAYKQIATDLLRHVFVQTGQEKVPGKDVNLISLIKNDQQLVNLFIEKLRLTFHQPPPTANEQE
jgi:ABC-type thiamine transport system substrate-binding protein